MNPDRACGRPPEDGSILVAFPSHELADQPYGDRRIGTVGDRLAVEHADIARVEIDLAREISQTPSDLYTAILVDGSRSLDAEQRNAQRAIVDGYLRGAPRGRVQIIAYDRNPHPLFRSWIAASDALARTRTALTELVPRNGSNVDRGLAEAATWLARANGTRRIVLLTDELVAQRLASIPPIALRERLPADTVVHVVVLDVPIDGTLPRDDDGLFAPLAVATEGIAVHGGTDGAGHVDATKLIRPIALEHVAITAPGWTKVTPTDDSCTLDGTADLDEGSSCAWWGTGDTSSGPVRIEGLVWNRPFVRIVQPDPSQGRSVARILSAIGTGFEADVALEIDLAAVAVNSAWSLFGTWGGRAGYGDIAPGGEGHGSGIGLRGIGTTSRDRGQVTAVPAPRLPSIEDQIGAGIARCGLRGAKARVTLELTREEIVDVDVTMEPGSPGQRACIEAAIWDVDLRLPFNPPAHDVQTLSFG